MTGVGGPYWYFLGSLLAFDGFLIFPFLFFFLFHFSSTARYPSAHFFWDTEQEHIGWLYIWASHGTVQNCNKVFHHTVVFHLLCHVRMLFPQYYSWQHLDPISLHLVKYSLGDHSTEAARARTDHELQQAPCRDPSQHSTGKVPNTGSCLSRSANTMIP